jgi:hypothetical protein
MNAQIFVQFQNLVIIRIAKRNTRIRIIQLYRQTNSNWSYNLILMLWLQKNFQ